MKLGAFSVSLSVKDINTSKAFYEALGFTVFAGKVERNYLIMKNEETVIGLFQGMFENNMLTFNPGWDSNINQLSDYNDIRDIQKSLREAGINPISQIDENTSGPASITVVDPDGNAILIDQHVG